MFVVVPEREYQPGVYQASLAVKNTAKGARVQLTRTASVLAAIGDVCTCRVLVSDDQQDWTLLRTITIPGGPVLDKTGAVASESWFQFLWPGEYVDGQRTALKRTHVRAEVTVLQRVRTEIRVESVV